MKIRANILTAALCCSVLQCSYIGAMDSTEPQAGEIPSLLELALSIAVKPSTVFAIRSHVHALVKSVKSPAALAKLYDETVPVILNGTSRTQQLSEYVKQWFYSNLAKGHYCAEDLVEFERVCFGNVIVLQRDNKPVVLSTSVDVIGEQHTNHIQVQLGNNNQVNIWRFDVSGKVARIGTLVHNRWIKSVTSNQQGTKLACGLEDGKVVLWNIDNLSAAIHSGEFQAHTHPIKSVIWYDNDTKLVTCAAYENEIKIWNIVDQTNPTCLALITGHIGGVGAITLVPSYDSFFNTTRPILISGSNDKIITWDLSDARKPQQLQILNVEKEITDSSNNRRVTTLTSTVDGKRLISGHQDGTLTCWNMPDIKNIDEVACIKGHDRAIDAIMITGNGSLLVSTSADQMIKVWDISDYPSIKHISTQEGAKSWSNTSVAPYLNGFISAGGDGKIRRWHPTTFLYVLCKHTLQTLLNDIAAKSTQFGKLCTMLGISKNSVDEEQIQILRKYIDQVLNLDERSELEALYKRYMQTRI